MLLILVGSVVALIVGVTQFGFYIDELSAVFLIAGVLAGIVGGLKPGEMTDEFIKGCGNLFVGGNGNRTLRRGDLYSSKHKYY